MLLYPKAVSGTLGKLITASEAQKRGLKGELTNPHDFYCDGAGGTCTFPLTCVNMLRKGTMSPHFRPSSRTASHVKGCEHTSEPKHAVAPREPSMEEATTRPPQSETIYELKLFDRKPMPTHTDSGLPPRGKRRLTSNRGDTPAEDSWLSIPTSVDFANLVDKYCRFSCAERKAKKLRVNKTDYFFDDFFRSVSKLVDNDEGLHAYFGAGRINRAKDTDKWYIKFSDAPSVLCVISSPLATEKMFIEEDKKRFANFEKRTDLTFFVLGEIHTSNGVSYINSPKRCGICFPEHIEAIAF